MKISRKALLSIFLSILILMLLMPSVTWLFMPAVDTQTIIALENGYSLLPRSVIKDVDKPCVFLLIPDISFWEKGYIAVCRDIHIIDVYEDSVLISETFNPSDEFIVIEKMDISDGAQVKRKT